MSQQFTLGDFLEVTPVRHKSIGAIGEDRSLCGGAGDMWGSWNDVDCPACLRLGEERRLYSRDPERYRVMLDEMMLEVAG